MSCGADIPPAFVHSLESNICPGCGQFIMNSETKDFMNELASALDRMPNDSQGVAGWLLSNYRFQKMGNCEPVDKFHRKGSVPNQVNDNYSEFVTRNEAAGLVKKSSELSSKFKGSVNVKVSECASLIQTLDDPYDGEPEKISNDVNIDDQKAYMELKANGIDPFSDITEESAPSNIINALTTGYDGPSQIEKILSQSNEGKLILQNERMKKLKAQTSLDTGSNKNSFRRA
jgi:hypothetical protein